MLVSIIIRTYNEERYLNVLIESIKNQIINNINFEIIIVDSGSTDKTLDIAIKHACNIYSIKKEDFSFGKSLNIGCQNSNGEILVFISGHCIPATNDWLINLVNPIIDSKVVLTYGRQIGNEISKFSEMQVFKKYFPLNNKLPQEDFFCNNANSAILKETWERYKFDENLTGLEDMYLAKTLKLADYKIGYIANACVYHIHIENWRQIKNRYERESVALQLIMPEIHFTFLNLLIYLVSSIYYDSIIAFSEKKLLKNIVNIIKYRSAQYYGSYIGNHSHRKISRKLKEKYFYPK